MPCLSLTQEEDLAPVDMNLECLSTTDENAWREEGVGSPTESNPVATTTVAGSCEILAATALRGSYS